MHFLTYRPVCRYCFCFVFASLFIALLSPAAAPVILGVAAAGAGILGVLLLLRGKTGKLAGLPGRLLPYLLAVTLAAGAGTVARTLYPAALEQREGKTVSVKVEIRQVFSDTATLIYAQGMLREIDGESVSIPVRLEYDLEDELQTGDVLAGRAVLSRTSLYSAETGRLYRSGTLAVLTDWESGGKDGYSHSLPVLFRQLQERLSLRLRTACPGESGKLYAALLLGDRSGIYTGFYQDFPRLGISHMLAISGMHFSLLILSFEKLLRLLRCPRKGRYLLCMAATVFYAGLTGFSPGVMRAALMLLFVLAAFLLGKNHDAPTALFLSVSLLLLCNPFCAYSVALWLSAGATLGILVLQEWRLSKAEEKQKNAESCPLPSPSLTRRLGRGLADNLLISLGALLVSLPITVTYAKELPLLTLPANLIFGVLIQACMYLALLSLLLGSLCPAVTGLCAKAGEGVLFLIHRAAEIPGTVLALDDIPSMVILLTGCLVLLHLLLLRRREKKVYLSVLLVMVLSITALQVGKAAYRQSVLDTYYLADKNGAYLLIRYGNETVLYDASVQTASLRDRALETLKRSGARELDCLILPQYLYRSERSVQALLLSVPVRKLMLAAPKSSAEKARFDTICRIAEERGVSYTVYNEDTFLSFGHCDITLLSSERRFDREKADYAIRVAAFDRSLLFCSCAAAEVYPPERLLPLLRESSVLLFSPQGPSAARWNQLYNRLSLECMVVGNPDKLCLPEENKTGETVLVSPEEYLVTFRR